MEQKKDWAFLQSQLEKIENDPKEKEKFIQYFEEQENHRKMMIKKVQSKDYIEWLYSYLTEIAKKSPASKRSVGGAMNSFI